MDEIFDKLSDPQKVEYLKRRLGIEIRYVSKLRDILLEHFPGLWLNFDSLDKSYDELVNSANAEFSDLSAIKDGE